jgi:hypothetical protein
MTADRAYYDELLEGTAGGLWGRGMYDGAGLGAAATHSAAP